MQRIQRAKPADISNSITYCSTIGIYTGCISFFNILIISKNVMRLRQDAVKSCSRNHVSAVATSDAKNIGIDNYCHFELSQDCRSLYTSR